MCVCAVHLVGVEDEVVCTRNDGTHGATRTAAAAAEKRRDDTARGGQLVRGNGEQQLRHGTRGRGGR